MTEDLSSVVLDPSKLDKMAEDLSGDVMKQVLAAGRESVSSSAQDLMSAWEAKDIGRIARASHQLKGAAGLNGLEALQLRAQAINAHTKTLDYDSIEPLMTDFSNDLEQALKALSAWRAPRS